MELTPAEKRRKIEAQKKEVIKRRPGISDNALGVGGTPKYSTSADFGKRPLNIGEKNYYKNIQPSKTYKMPKDPSAEIPGYTPLSDTKSKTITSEPAKPSFNAMGTIPRNLGTPERSPVFNKARENLQKGFDMSAFGSPYVKDPVTGKNIERAGYHNEAGTFIPEQRLAVKDVGPMFSYLSSSIRNPDLHKTLLEGLMKKAGVTPETEGMGAGLNRSLEERLMSSKLASAERIAKTTGQFGVDEANVLAGTPYYQQDRSGGSGLTSGRYKSFGDEGGILDSATGTVSNPATELPDHVKKQAQALKNKSQEDFDDWAARQDANTRLRLKELGF